MYRVQIKVVVVVVVLFVCTRMDVEPVNQDLTKHTIKCIQEPPPSTKFPEAGVSCPNSDTLYKDFCRLSC